MVAVVFTYSKERIHEVLADNYAESRNTCKTLKLDLNDLLDERLVNMARYVLTKLSTWLYGREFKASPGNNRKQLWRKVRVYKTENMPVFRYRRTSLPQSLTLEIVTKPILKLSSQQQTHGLKIVALDVHSAVYAIRREVDLSLLHELGCYSSR